MQDDTRVNYFFRVGFLLALIIALLAIAGSFYFEEKLNLMPCPMCIGQRISMMGTAIFMFLSVIIVLCIRRDKALKGAAKGLTGFFVFLAWICVCIGLYIAISQVYLQSLPPGKAPACGPGLNYLVKVLPWQKVVAVVFHGSGECAKVSWRFLSLSIAGWSAITFIITWIIIVVSFISFLRDK